MKRNNTLSLFLLIWLIVNLFQGFFTELIHDEAYYWFYSTDLDWGYFDHPPMIGLLVFLGYAIFPNELGVRLIPILMNVATIWLIWKIIDGKNPLLFAAILGSSVIIHIGGFLAVPDIPIMFFSAAFLFFFKQFLESKNWINTIFLALSISGMAYSKLTGVLLVFFALIPNIRLLLNKRFWLVIFFVIFSLIPYVLWQIEHEFVTFRYQFLDRSNVPYRLSFFFNYLLGQLLVYGPFVGFIIFFSSAKFKAKTRFDKTMKCCFWGIFGFFLIQSLRMRIEPNWTTVGAIPLFYTAYHLIVQRSKLKRLIIKWLLPSLVLIIIFRVYLMVDFLPNGWNPRNEFHGWDSWANSISKAAGDLPVVFHNSFQKPSKFMFYSGKYAHSVNAVNYAGFEYDLKVEREEYLQNQTVFRIHNYGKDSLKAFGMRSVNFDIVKDFQYFNRIKIRTLQNSFQVPVDTNLTIPIIIENPTNKEIDFSVIPEGKLKLQYCLFWYGQWKETHLAMEIFPIKKLAPGETFETFAKIKTPKTSGKHWRFRFAIETNGFVGRNSNFVPLRIE